MKETTKERAYRLQNPEKFECRRLSAINSAEKRGKKIPKTVPTKRKALATSDPVLEGKTSKRSLRKGTATAIKQLNKAKHAKAQAVAQAQRAGLPKLFGGCYATL